MFPNFKNCTLCDFTTFSVITIFDQMPDVFQNTEISKKILLNITIKIDNIPLVKPVFNETVELLKCTPPPSTLGKNGLVNSDKIFFVKLLIFT